MTWLSGEEREQGQELASNLTSPISRCANSYRTDSIRSFVLLVVR